MTQARTSAGSGRRHAGRAEPRWGRGGEHQGQRLAAGSGRLNSAGARRGPAHSTRPDITSSLRAPIGCLPRRPARPLAVSRGGRPNAAGALTLSAPRAIQRPLVASAASAWLRAPETPWAGGVPERPPVSVSSRRPGAAPAPPGCVTLGTRATSLSLACLLSCKQRRMMSLAPSLIPRRLPSAGHTWAPRSAFCLRTARGAVIIMGAQERKTAQSSRAAPQGHTARESQSWESDPQARPQRLLVAASRCRDKIGVRWARPRHRPP